MAVRSFAPFSQAEPSAKSVRWDNTAKTDLLFFINKIM